MEENHNILESLPEADRQKADVVIRMTTKKHVKIWALHELGLLNKDVAKLLGTNAGHVGNEVRRYNQKENMIADCRALVETALKASREQA